MRTPGIVAVARSDGGWEGVPVLEDVEPSKLGKRIWELFHEQCDGDAGIFVEKFIYEFPGGWIDFGVSGHNSGSMNNNLVTNKTVDIRWTGWIYVIDYDHLQVKARARFPHEYVTLRRVGWNDEEPNWEHLEDLAIHYYGGSRMRSLRKKVLS